MTSPADLTDLSATELKRRLAEGSVRAAELAEACLTRIGEREEAVQAWTFLDTDTIRAQARALDDHRAGGRPIGPLHGLPVAITDIIDT